MISDKGDFIFVHIKKTAGTSVGEALKPFGEVEQSRKHLTAKKYISEIGLNEFDKAFSFSIVRNPFGRIVSLYYHKMLRTKSIPETMGFKQWLLEHLPRHGSYLDKATMIESLTYNGEIVVDFIARFENLSQDWKFICSKIGIEDYSLPTTNKSLSSGTRRYWELYDDETICYVKEVYKDDLEAFNYRIE